jgi:hypothetical protein
MPFAFQQGSSGFPGFILEFFDPIFCLIFLHESVLLYLTWSWPDRYGLSVKIIFPAIGKKHIYKAELGRYGNEHIRNKSKRSAESENVRRKAVYHPVLRTIGNN